MTRTAIVTDAPDDNLLMPRGAAFVQGLVWRVVLHANRFQDIPMLPGAIVRVAFVALAAAACHQSSVTAPPRPTSRSAGQRDEITRKDIEPLLRQASSAYDIVKLLRPTMLLNRTLAGIEPTARVAANEMPGVHVHIDDTRVGPIDMLETIPAQAVSSIRWLSPSEASTKYGNGHTTGVIAVSTLVGKW